MRREHEAAARRIRIPRFVNIAAPIDATRHSETLGKSAERRLLRTLAVDRKPRIGAGKQRHRGDQSGKILLRHQTPDRDHARRARRQCCRIGCGLGALDRDRVIDTHEAFGGCSPILHEVTNEIVGYADRSRRITRQQRRQGIAQPTEPAGAVRRWPVIGQNNARRRAPGQLCEQVRGDKLDVGRGADREHDFRLTFFEEISKPDDVAAVGAGQRHPFDPGTDKALVLRRLEIDDQSDMVPGSTQFGRQDRGDPLRAAADQRRKIDGDVPPPRQLRRRRRGNMLRRAGWFGIDKHVR